MGHRRINLLFIVSSLCFGGAEKHAITLADKLNPERYRVSLAYLKNDDEALLPQVDQERLGGRVFCCHVSSKVDGRAIRRLGAYIDDNGIDIVVCVNTYPLLYGQLAKARARCDPRLVEIFHTTELESLEDQLQMLFYRPFIGFSDMLVYVCENQRRYWRSRLLRARSDGVIHNGIEAGHFADRYTSQQKMLLRQQYGFFTHDYVVGLCAAMRPEKAHGDLLQAIARLHAAGVNAKCLFIGDGPERPKLEKQIEALRLGEHVRITGFMKDVRPAIAICDAMAIVSHHVETFSIAALEAMALGKPMVMSRIGGASEQVQHGENGYLYERGDIGALADALRKLSDRPQSRQMGERARALVERKFSLAVMLDAYDRLFSSLAGMTVVDMGKVNVA